MSLPFESVREELLRAGIAPRHANRYVIELREHLADLTARERAAGLDPKQSVERAGALLGSDAELARAMIDKGAPRAWAARAPLAVFAVLPVLLLVGVIWAVAISMMHLLEPVGGLAPADMAQRHGWLIAAVSFVVCYLVGPLLAAGSIAVALRQRLTSHWVWIGLLLVASISGLFGFHMHVNPSASSHGVDSHFGVVGVIYVHGHRSLEATLGVAALRAAVLFGIAATAYRFMRMRLAPLGAQVRPRQP
jgi:hypothetical protein